MKKQHKLFLCIFVLLFVAGIILSPHLYLYFFDQDMAHRQFSVISSTKSKLENQLLRFEFDNDDLDLYYQPILRDSLANVYYLDTDDQAHAVSASEFVFDNCMSGTFIAVADSVIWDIDSDGTDEEVVVCAKADTNEVQGYSDYSNRFGDALDIPIELVKNGRTSLIVLKDGTEYTGRITLYKSGIEGVEMDIVDGNIDFVDVHGLWDGVSVVIDEDNRLLVASYVAEEHTVFTMQHLEACIPFFFLILLIAVGIVGVLFVRRQVYRYGCLQPWLKSSP